MRAQKHNAGARLAAEMERAPTATLLGEIFPALSVSNSISHQAKRPSHTFIDCLHPGSFEVSLGLHDFAWKLDGKTAKS